MVCALWRTYESSSTTDQTEARTHAMLQPADSADEVMTSDVHTAEANNNTFVFSASARGVLTSSPHHRKVSRYRGAFLFLYPGTANADRVRKFAYLGETVAHERATG